MLVFKYGAYATYAAGCLVLFVASCIPSPTRQPEPLRIKVPNHLLPQRDDGTNCRTGSQCKSGICEGPGCDNDKGRCASHIRMCTRDLRPYCGCDGKTFYASSTCPKRRYHKREACNADAPGRPSVMPIK